MKCKFSFLNIYKFSIDTWNTEREWVIYSKKQSNKKILDPFSQFIYNLRFM